MRFRVTKWVLRFAPTLAFSSVLAYGAGTGEASIVFVADSRGLTGWRAFCTNLYNEDLLYFALLTVILMPVLAVILGSITNYFLSRSGINLKSRVLAEH